MKKTVSLLMGLLLVCGSGASLAACGSGDGGSTENCLTIRYYQGGYGDEWLKDSVNNFLTEKLGRAPVADKDYKLIPDKNITANQGNYLKNASQAPDILMTQGGYDAYIEQGLVENISSVYETEVTKLDGSKVKVKDYMLPEAYQSVTRQMKYGSGSVQSWAMPWSAECFSLAYNEDLLLDTVHVASSYTVGEDIEVGGKWTRTPTTVDELLAYFADVNAGTSGKIPFGWSYPSALQLQFIIDVWWAQIQGTRESKITGEGSFYDFFNFNDLDLLDQTGIQNAFDTLRSLVIDSDGNYINSEDKTLLFDMQSNYFNQYAAEGRYAVWVAGDYFENEYIKTLDTAPTFTTKMMFVPNAKGIDGAYTTEKLTYIRTDEAFYVPAKAKNKELAKEFLAYMCNEAELLNYSKKCGGLRPFDYNPVQLDSTYSWTEFQKSFYNIYNNADEVIIEYPANVTDASKISPIYLYQKQSVHFFMTAGNFEKAFSDVNRQKPASEIMAKIKEDHTSLFENQWKRNYAGYFATLVK